MGLSVHFSTMAEMFSRISEHFAEGQRPSLMAKTDGSYRGIGYGELHREVARFALGLRAVGVRKGENIALISENRPEWVVADMGMMHLGAVNVPLYPTMTAKQIEYIFNDATISLAIVSNQLQLSKVLKIRSEVPSLKKIIVMNEIADTDAEGTVAYASVLQQGDEALADEPDFLRKASRTIIKEDLLTVIYTSGTTGTPKGVMITHHNMASNITSSAACLPIESGDILLSFLPLCHSFERMAGYYTAMACGATIAYAESIDAIRENILEVRPTIMASVPRLFERIHQRILRQIESEPPWRRKIFDWGMRTGKQFGIAKRRKRISPSLAVRHAIAERLVYRKLRERTGGRMKYFVSGGAPLAPELGEFFDAIGLPIIEGYGLSESSPVISVNPLEDYRFGTVGKPIPGVEVAITNDGEILARGPNITGGYWNDPAATREIIDGDGWLHTGDIGHLDKDGYLHITDRKKHLFVSSGGKNIAPQPIENLFLMSRYIEQFVLIGDRRMYCSALIVPDAEALRAKNLSLSGAAGSAVIDAPEVVKFFEDEIAAIQKDLPNYERVRKFTLLRNAFTQEGGELTPTMKIRRKLVEEKYKAIIERMYEGAR